MFSVTIYRSDTASENKGKIEFKVESEERVQALVSVLGAATLPPLFGWVDVDGKAGFLASSLIAKVEISENK